MSWCTLQLLSGTFLNTKISPAKKNLTRYCHKCTQIFTQSIRYSCQILMKLDVSRQISAKKCSNIKFHENPSSGSRVSLFHAGGQTTRPTAAFRNFAHASKQAYPSAGIVPRSSNPLGVTSHSTFKVKPIKHYPILQRCLDISEIYCPMFGVQPALTIKG